MLSRPLAIWLLSLLSFSSYASSEIDAKIIGGLNASLGYSWMVSIEYYSVEDQTAYRQHFCGGALIHEQWVLTAAHCVLDEQDNVLSPEEIVLLIGKKDISISAHEIHAVESIIVHDDYARTDVHVDNDIALIKLRAPALEAPISLASKSLTNDISEGTPVSVAGWGDTEYPENEIPTFVLQEVQVPLRTQEQCSEVYEEFDGDVLCTGAFNGGVDPCFGDSGGPLFIVDDGYHYHLGIVSFGMGCALAGQYAVYTKTASYQSWISSKIDPGSGDSGGSTGWIFIVFSLFVSLRLRMRR